jgi:hypothetical protein
VVLPACLLAAFVKFLTIGAGAPAPRHAMLMAFITSTKVAIKMMPSKIPIFIPSCSVALYILYHSMWLLSIGKIHKLLCLLLCVFVQVAQAARARGGTLAPHKLLALVYLSAVAFRQHFSIAQAVSLLREGHSILDIDYSIHFYSPFVLAFRLLPHQ